jgi:toxin FitB
VRGFLLDTNVLSELRRPLCNPNVLQFIDTQPDRFLFTSDVNLAEIRFGIDKSADAEKRRQLTEWLATVLRPWFAGNLVDVNEDVLCIWRHIVENGRIRGYTFPEPDGLIGAVAKHHRLIVVSRDTAPFLAATLPVLDLWNSRFHATGGKSIEALNVGDANLLETLREFENSAGS